MNHSLIITAIILITAPLFAQETEEPDSAITYKLREIVITAARGGGEVLQVPMAVGIVDMKDFLRSRRTGLNDALWAMPGVLVQSRAGGQDVRLTVRGFGARGQGDRSNAATIRGIKVLLDGIPETEPDGRTALDLIDLHAASRIEVVRSNASTLFGNASGGVINIDSHTFFTKPFVEINTLLGSFGLRRNNFKLGVPVGSGRFSLSVSNAHFDGWRANTKNENTQLHATLLADLDEVTTLKLVASGALNKFQIPGPLTLPQFDNDPTQANATYAARNERRANQVGRFGFSFSKSFDQTHTLELIGYIAPKVLQRSERGTFRDFNRYHIGGGAVYQWKPGDGSWLSRVTAGVDEAYQNGTILFYNLVNGDRGDSLRTNKREGANTLGVFAQAELRVAEQLSLILGGRFDRQSYISKLFAAGVQQSPRNDRLNLDHFTPKAALLFRFSSRHSLYLSIGGGVEAPAFNEVDSPPTLTGVELNPLLKPMSSTTVEAGIKGYETLSDHPLLKSLSYSFAAYAITVNNEIVPFDGGVWFFSAGESRRRGFEVGTQMDFRYGLSLVSAFTYLEATYLKYANELGNFAGNAVPGIPSAVLNARLRYAHRSSLFAELGFENLSSYFADDGSTASVPSYTVLNASAGYSLRLGNLSFHGFIGLNNVADRKYASSAFINPVTRTGSGSPLAPAYLEPGLPRNFFGGIDLHIDL